MLQKELEELLLKKAAEPPPESDLILANHLRSRESCDLAHAVLEAMSRHTLQVHYKTSIAMLKRRDFWFDKLAPGYDDYTVCKDWAQPLDPRTKAPPDAKANAYCELHVALDRVLWRGDYAVRVLVDGTTLTSVLKSSVGRELMRYPFLCRVSFSIRPSISAFAIVRPSRER
jgi:hypothetical protein